MKAKTIIKVERLRKVYGKQTEKKYEALKAISFEVAQGEFVGIMGASGSGKTTLLNMLATFDHPTSGTVKINDTEVSRLKGNQLADFRAKEIGFIFQDFNLLENLTAAENIGLALSLQNVKPKTIENSVVKIAATLGISDLLEKYPSELSGGQKQRVACARALVHDPTILFGDEPTGALDSKSARELLELMYRVNEQQKTSILMVTHDAFSASFCKRIIFIKDGQVEHELVKQVQASRTQFYQEILDILGTFEK
ncbi:ABC transporter ATP-binding protein [Liquorilactobacillus satsumensis]|uniref:ABC transporter, ATP-binding protein n=1 Tax=Liquorilactobacillus satsumensis DSM 16230 = JCM 12392 TaxID=1423801 RepID=A0A0R1UUU2_9LACO|nr:ABC transporter ATP-binding protein [Liquorilactobacillus satsumensis]KRL96928.1 ABC transporter, ATP-binding protein [Liquorilactobacillus satsumensis DSM 16230 = JCM 12392]MCC7667817.1 ABC transporter ATP-binding protein [Liquorilactobacillus satsumensis]MCP9312439.1 ABC transporter ATP-binding protein [Liquorilactobacillus satsumensis]MCP9329025.1 ABC transporter ATP-binding protein [Liquorilactobacillus satsumensis]MCP9358551.1 ABC transporter ATP-binding protein [Liquorilactobacillus s